MTVEYGAGSISAPMECVKHPSVRLPLLAFFLSSFSFAAARALLASGCFGCGRGDPYTRKKKNCMFYGSSVTACFTAPTHSLPIRQRRCCNRHWPSAEKKHSSLFQSLAIVLSLSSLRPRSSIASSSPTPEGKPLTRPALSRICCAYETLSELPAPSHSTTYAARRWGDYSIYISLFPIGPRA